MLNNCSNQAFEELKKEGIDPVKAIKILNTILPLSEEKAKNILRKFLSEDKLRYILNLTHREPSNSAILIVEKSIIDKLKSISYIGNWSHRKADIWLKSKNLGREDFVKYLMDRYKIEKIEAEDLYNQIRLVEKRDLSNWISFIQQTYSPLIKGKREDNLVFFNNGVVFNLSNKRVRLSTGGKFGIPKALIIFEKGQLKETVYEDADLDLDCLVICEGDEFKSLLLDRNLSKSLAIRLYYLKGEGLKYFEPLWEEKDGEDFIYVYKINWKGKR